MFAPASIFMRNKPLFVGSRNQLSVAASELGSIRRKFSATRHPVLDTGPNDRAFGRYQARTLDRSPG